MALCGVSTGAMADVACGEKTAPCDRLCRFAHNHTVHCDQIAGFHVDERELVLRRDLLGDRTGTLPEVYGGSGSKWNEGDEDVIAWINLKSGVGHWGGS